MPYNWTSSASDTGGIRWCRHTITYSVNKAKAGDGSTSFAQFVLCLAEDDPSKRTLYLFHLKSAFILAPDLIYLRSCSSSAGFLGIGSSHGCHDVPTLIPRTLDLASLGVRSSYLTEVGLSMGRSCLTPTWIACSTSIHTSEIPMCLKCFEGVLADCLEMSSKNSEVMAGDGHVARLKQDELVGQ